MRTAHFVMLISFFFSSQVFSQIYVDMTATGTMDGSSWENAYNQIYNATANVVEGDELWIAAGEYKAGPDRTSWHQPVVNIKMFGGFSGTETSIDQRDFTTNITRISGDLNDDDTAGDFENNRSDNMEHLVWLTAGLDNNTIFDGITFSGGQSQGSSGNDDNRRGGAILSYGAPVIANCVFEDNFAWFGGAVYLRFEDASNATVLSTSFIANGAGSGGAMYINSLDASVFSSLIFDSNVSENNGGAVYFQASTGSWDNCEFVENKTDLDSRAGAIYSTESNLTMDACQFIDNESFRTGGAIHSRTDSAVFVTTNLTNCVFSGNMARNGWGGAITIYGDVDGGNDFNIAESDFSLNSCVRSGGAMSVGFTAQATITETSFSGNTSSESGGAIFGQNEMSSIQLEDCNFGFNNATTAGGAISCGGGQQTHILRTTFNQNSGERGGAINVGEDSMDVAELTVHQCIFTGNSGETQGGAINIGNTSTLINNSLMTNNFASNDGFGGAISNNVSDGDSDTISIVNSTFIDNNGQLASITQWTDSDTSGAILQLLNNIIESIGTNYAVEEGSPEVISLGGNISSDLSLQSYLVQSTDHNQTMISFVNGAYLSAPSIAINGGVDHQLVSDVDLDDNPRVGPVDIGAYEYQILINVNNLSQGLGELSVMPNPTTTDATIHLDTATKGILILSIINSQGQRVQGFEIKQLHESKDIRMDVSSLLSGIYTVLVESENGKRSTVPLVIAKKR